MIDEDMELERVRDALPDSDTLSKHDGETLLEVVDVNDVLADSVTVDEPDGDTLRVPL